MVQLDNPAVHNLRQNISEMLQAGSCGSNHMADGNEVDNDGEEKEIQIIRNPISTDILPKLNNEGKCNKNVRVVCKQETCLQLLFANDNKVVAVLQSKPEFEFGQNLGNVQRSMSI